MTTVDEVRHRRWEWQIVDVRSPGEFAAGHLPGALPIPMEQIEVRVEDLDRHQPVLLVCQAGQRATLCRDWLSAKGVEAQVLAGGVNAWSAAGYPLVRTARSRWSLERQVRLGAGAMVLGGSVLAACFGPLWLLLTGFAGAGLTIAGLTGFCGMANLLAIMPWNRTARTP